MKKLLKGLSKGRLIWSIEIYPDMKREVRDVIGEMASGKRGDRGTMGDLKRWE